MNKLKRCIYCTGSALYFIFPPFLLNVINAIFTYLISGYHSRRFGRCGLNFNISKNATIVGAKYMIIGSYVSIGKRAVLTAWVSNKNKPQILIGEKVVIGDDCHITATNNIIIGSNVLMGKKITITDNSHGKTNIGELSLPPLQRPLYSKGPVIIKDGVWIGDKVTILAGVTIGENAIVGANTVVTKNVPKNCVVGGIPSKIIKIMS